MIDIDLNIMFDYLIFQIDSAHVLGAEARLHSHPTKKNTDMPKMMFPVEKYASGQ